MWKRVLTIERPEFRREGGQPLRGWKVMAACGVGKRVQKIQKVQRVQRVVDCPAGNAYKVSVTGLAFVSPVLLNKE